MPSDFDVMANKGLWDKTTRNVLEKRLATVHEQTFFSPDEVRVLEKLVSVLLPGVPEDIPIVDILGSGLTPGDKEGVRLIDLPWRPEMYKRGLAFLEKEAESEFGAGIVNLSDEQLSTLFENISTGSVQADTWEFPANLLFRNLVSDIAAIYYSFPQSWNEIKFAGPAFPKGYYKLEYGEKMKYEPDLEDTEGASDGN